MSQAALLARHHWNATPLYIPEKERYSIYPWLYEAAEFRHHRGHKVLEVGCGTGCDLLQFAKHGAVATGIDITEKHLELAHERVGDAAQVLKGDMLSLPFPHASFDYVYSHGVLHHSDKPEQAANEILRVLKPGGRFNIHLYSLFSVFALKRVLMYGFQWRKHIENSTEPVHIDLYTVRRFRKLFPNCKLTFQKHQANPLPLLAPWFGWFLIGTGTKPL